MAGAKPRCLVDLLPRHRVSTPILVVEDDTHLRAMLQVLLEEEGYPVRAAADGRAALEYARSNRPSLVILDIGLPGLDGTTVAEQLRTYYEADLPIVVISANGRAAASAAKIGAQSYLDKPFDVDHLLQAVWRALRAE